MLWQDPRLAPQPACYAAWQVVVQARLVAWTPSNTSVPSATPESAMSRAALDLTVFNNASSAVAVQDPSRLHLCLQPYV